MLSPPRRDSSSSGTSIPSASTACSLELQPLEPGPSYNTFTPGFELALPDLVSDSLFNNSLASIWFTALETWEVRSPAPETILPIRQADLDQNTNIVFRWLSQWINEGSCPFIHSELYHERFPKCLQEAYVVLSTYIHRTPASERIVFRIIEEQAVTLVREQSDVNKSPREEKEHPPLDALEHLARVYALLIYQAIGLYDGDIRLRHIAEQHIPILENWMQALLLHTRQTVFLGAPILVPSHVPSATAGTTTSSLLGQNLLWYTWILAESIRRTWIVASGLQAAYLIAREGEPVACQGGMMFTTRQGVWEARTAGEWESICCRVNVGLVQMVEVQKVMERVSPDEVNEFAKFIIDITLGKERLRSWVAEKEASKAL